MYHVSKFEDRHMMAISVPPSVHPDLSEDFMELSRIHFYLGRAPIDHMVQAVENASLEEIDKGKLQIYFATKEIQEFLSDTFSSIYSFSEKSLNPEIYFQNSFDKILTHTLEVLESSYKKPTKKNNVVTIETMIGLTHEVQFLHHELSKVGIITNIDKIEEIKTQFEKIYNLKSHYENLTPLKNFSDYSDDAQKAVVEQLKTPYEFNYSEMARNIYVKHDDWMPTVRYLSEERKKIDEPDYQINIEETQKLKDDFLKQFKSFNSLLKNGIVNYVHSFSAILSKEIYYNIQKSLVSAESYFEKEIGYHKKSLDNTYRDKDYHKEKIKNLEAIKEDFIQQKIDDKSFYERYLTILYRQEKNISQTLDKIRSNLFNLNLKDTVTFEGDINKGFVIGTFSVTDKVLLVHKDTFVNVPEAIYAMVISKDTYNDLIKNKQLEFTENFREQEFSNASNFWSYGQFLQEISDSSIQKFFLGKEFDLIDNTVLLTQEKETKRKNKM